MARFHAEPDLLIALDWSPESEDRARKLMSSTNALRCLVIREPEVVMPRVHSARGTSSFSHLVYCGFPKNDFRDWPEHGIEYDHSELAFSPNPEILQKAVMVNANKFSAIYGELYSLRRQVSELPIVDTFGLGWSDRSLKRVALDLVLSAVEGVYFGKRLSLGKQRPLRPKVHAHLGIARNKLETLHNYRTTVAIENSSDYSSEKLIDPILAGSIPVYVGSRHVRKLLPDGLVVFSQPNIESVRDGIFESFEISTQEWWEIRNSYLGSKGFERFTQSGQAKMLASHLLNISP